MFKETAIAFTLGITPWNFKKSHLRNRLSCDL